MPDSGDSTSRPGTSNSAPKLRSSVACSMHSMLTGSPGSPACSALQQAFEVLRWCFGIHEGAFKLGSGLEPWVRKCSNMNISYFEMKLREFVSLIWPRTILAFM